jgi:hypothetical protein
MSILYQLNQDIGNVSPKPRVKLEAKNINEDSRFAPI